MTTGSAPTAGDKWASRQAGPWWSTGLWSMLLAAAVLVPAVPRLASPPPSCVIDVTLSARRPGTVELFYDIGRGYNGGHMSSADFAAGGPTTVSLSIPDGTYPQIRLDPTTCRDEVTIESLMLRHVERGTRIAIPLASLRAAHELVRVEVEGDHATVVSEGEDPILFIEPSVPLQVGTGVRPWAAARLTGAFLAATATIWGLWMLGSSLVRRRPAATRRVAGLVALASLLAAPRLVGLDQPLLLDFHDFRQTQTALTAFWFAADGVTLPAYPLPVLGRPWTAPIEFPLYQLAAAAVHRIGVPIDAACRGTTLVTFVAAIVVFLRVLVRHGAPRPVIAVLAVLALSSPFALVWSKASLIEFTAVLCGVVFAGLAADCHAGGLGIARWLLMAIAGTAAALAKITTFAVFWPAGMILAADRLWHLRREGVAPRRLVAEAAAWALVLAIPLLVGQAWVAVADHVKAASEATVPLTSARLDKWMYGTLAQRLDYRNWRVILRRITADVLPVVWPLAIYGLVSLRRLPRRIALLGFGTLAGACAAVSTFFNVYVVHDYYLCAVVIPLWLAAAAGLWGLAERIHPTRLRRLIVPATLMIMIIAASRSFMVNQTYGHFVGHETLGFCRDVQRAVPADEEIVVVGEDWNPRIPYYTQRKAFMAWRGVPTAVVRDYVTRQGLRHLVVCRTGNTAALGLMPDSDPVLVRGNYELRRLRPPAP